MAGTVKIQGPYNFTKVCPSAWRLDRLQLRQIARYGKDESWVISKDFENVALRGLVDKFVEKSVGN